MSEMPTINGGPKLSDHLVPGFDYAKFCRMVDRDTHLTPEFRTLAKEYFNPDGEYEAFIRQMAKFYRLRPPPFSCEDFQSHPVHKLWNEAWQEACTHYQDKIQKYEKATLNARRRLQKKLDKDLPAEDRALHEAQIRYPHVQPSLWILPSPDVQNYVNACVYKLVPSISVSEGFLAAPPSEQKLIFRHELAHFFEPVKAKLLPLDYCERKLEGVFWRHKYIKAEEEADRYAMRAGFNENPNAVVESRMKHLRAENEFLEALPPDAPKPEKDPARCIIMHAKQAGFDVHDPKINETMAWDIQKVVEAALYTTIHHQGSEGIHLPCEREITDRMVDVHREKKQRGIASNPPWLQPWEDPSLSEKDKRSWRYIVAKEDDPKKEDAASRKR